MKGLKASQEASNPARTNKNRISSFSKHKMSLFFAFWGRIDPMEYSAEQNPDSHHCKLPA
jgi:hypothetical protein